MPGPPPKAARRQRSRRDMGTDIGALQRPGRAPAMPRNLCRAAQTARAAYWKDVVSGVTRPSDAPLVLRSATNLDRYYRLLAEADSEPIVTGSMGQPRANPIYGLVLQIEHSIKEDEAQVGIGPLNRLAARRRFVGEREVPGGSSGGSRNRHHRRGPTRYPAGRPEGMNPKCRGSRNPNTP